MVVLPRSVVRWCRVISARNMPVGVYSDSPNILIFPGRGNPGKDYAPDELQERILVDPIAVDSVDDILITEAYYYKVKSGVRHEFLIFEVTIKNDTHHHVNYIQLDRCPTGQLAEPLRSNAVLSSNAQVALGNAAMYVTMFPS
jgi:hypothetical protein